jgi:hypothetical protein
MKRDRRVKPDASRQGTRPCVSAVGGRRSNCLPWYGEGEGNKDPSVGDPDRRSIAGLALAGHVQAVEGVLLISLSPPHVGGPGQMGASPVAHLA